KWLAQYKGGSMYIFGSHLIDLAMLVMGKAPDDVYSFNKQTGKNGVYSKDNCFAVLDFGSALAKITNNSTEINGWGRRQLVVCGTKGTVEIKPLEVPTIMSYVNEKSTPGAYTDNTSRVDIESVPDSHRYDTMLLDFYKMCVGEAENPYSYDYELSLHKVILKACDIDI
ncbi:MAG: hypothetical protein IJZ20_04650, partial [Clostridia bacterium]|nr:hypothetical protein [Clostridia bacterium]